MSQTNKYKSVNSVIVGAEGKMHNENTQTIKNISKLDCGLFANDNTYAITFNPYLNQPDYKIIPEEHKKLEKTRQHITKPLNEPPTIITDNGKFIRKTHLPPTQFKPKYQKRENKNMIQGTCSEVFNTNIIY